MKFFLSVSFCLMILSSISCKNSTSTTAENSEKSIDSVTPSASTAQAADTSMNVVVKTFQVNDQWGYDLYINDKLYIHQPGIPSVPGNNGFKTADAAQKCGEFVANKIRHHIMPPSVTPHELDSLGVLN